MGAAEAGPGQRAAQGERSRAGKRRPGLAVLHEPPCRPDEATSGVDPISRRSFWDIIYARPRGTTVFVTTHTWKRASTATLAMMNRGK